MYKNTPKILKNFELERQSHHPLATGLLYRYIDILVSFEDRSYKLLMTSYKNISALMSSKKDRGFGECRVGPMFSFKYLSNLKQDLTPVLFG